jgi:hypothetical protein
MNGKLYIMYIDIYHESKKPYDYCFYKDTTLKTKVNYKF